MERFAHRRDHGLYRSRRGLVAGVCRGIAEYFDFKVGWVRFLVLLFILMSGIWPGLILYFIVAIVMKPEPVRPIENPDQQEFYDDYVRSRRNAAHRLKRRFESLDRRVRRMEDVVTAREFDWDRRMNP
jgi:phage shock protein C